MQAAAIRPALQEGDRSQRAQRLCLLLSVLLAVTAMVSLGWGASGT